jgi:hypothetical protein
MREVATMNNVHAHEVELGESARSCHEAASGAAEWLGLAAAPTFAAMALLTAMMSNGQQEIFCSAMHHGSPLGGMVSMYLLMAAFHLQPWLSLILAQHNGVRRS